jgi:hypothetical protein
MVAMGPLGERLRVSLKRGPAAIIKTSNTAYRIAVVENNPVQTEVLGRAASRREPIHMLSGSEKVSYGAGLRDGDGQANTANPMGWVGK